MHKVLIVGDCPPQSLEAITELLKERGVEAEFVKAEPRNIALHRIGHVAHSHHLLLASVLATALRRDLPEPPPVPEKAFEEMAMKIPPIDMVEGVDLEKSNQPFWREIGQNSKKARRAFQSKIKPAPRRY